MILWCNIIVLLRDIWTDWNWANTENIRIGLVFALFRGDYIIFNVYIFNLFKEPLAINSMAY
jgi:hypothetical protein